MVAEGVFRRPIPDCPLVRVDVPVQPQARVIADDVAAAYWGDQDSTKTWNLSTSFGPTMAPFDTLWIEARLPKTLWTNDGAGQMVAKDRASVGVTAEGHFVQALSIDGQPALRIKSLHETSRMVVESPFSVVIHLDERGHPIDERVGYTYTPEWAEAIEALAQSDGSLTPDVALFALGLMNCRNVRMEDVHETDKRRRAHRRKHGTAMARFKRIVLPGAMRSGGNASAAGEALPFHLIRGHFKTYTEEAPLFGKRVGTWWWGWQARGDEAIGTIDHEYEVTA